MSLHRLTSLLVATISTAAVVIAQPATTSAAAARPADLTHPAIMTHAAEMADASGSGPLTQTQPASTNVASSPGNALVGREVMGFVNAGNLGGSAGYSSWNLSLLSTVVYFSLGVDGNTGGLLTNTTGWAVYHSTTMSAFVQAAHSHGVRVLVSLNLHDFGTGVLNKTCEGLSSAVTPVTISQTLQQVKAAGIDGVSVDYEGNITTCANGLTNRDQLTQFMHDMRAAMPNYYIGIDTYSGSAEDNQEFFDITGIAPYVDSFFVMAYDMDEANYPYAPLNCPSYCFNPMSPLNTYRFNVTKSMTQYTALVPRSKVILGQPLYGREGCVWQLNGPAHQQNIPGYKFGTPSYYYASTVSSQAGVSNFSSHRDPGDGVSRYDTWSDSVYQCSMEQYWDDVTSLSAKFAVVNQYDLRGVGFFTLDYAGGAPELWSAIARYFSQIPGAPDNVHACAGNASAVISWTAAYVNGPAITGYSITSDIGGIAQSAPANATFATLTGLTAGTTYTFTVQAINSAGNGVGRAAVETVTPVATDPTSTGYFSWFDKATPGMLSDNIHIVNPGASAAAGCVTLPNRAVVPFTVSPSQETYVTLPAGFYGGPLAVTVNTGPAVLASQRVQYFNSFNEVQAMSPSQAATTSHLSWFDKVTPGMVADNIHVLNPGTVTASVTVSLAGATPVTFSLAGGAENYVTFPTGKIGGPVTVTADQPVLASQRVQYYQSFNEVVARSAAVATTTSYFNWFDKASPGMVADNVHVFNPGATTANVTVSMPGASPIKIAVAAGTEKYVTFGAGRIGGPVSVTSDQPVLSWQRVQYYQSFNEVPSESASQALTTSYVMWFDRVTPGMAGDNIHVLNPGTVPANVTLTLGTTQLHLTVAAGAEAYTTFGRLLGGPVVITSDQPVLAAQRVQYYTSFNEVAASG